MKARRAVWHPWSTGLALLGSLVFLGASVAGAPRTGLVDCGLVAIAYPMFRLLRRRVSGGAPPVSQTC